MRTRSLPNWRIFPDGKNHLAGSSKLARALGPALPTNDGLPPLMRRTFRRPAISTTGFCSCSTFARPSSDELALKLGQPDQHGQHKVSAWCRGDRPGAGQGPEARTMIGDRSQDTQ